MLFRLFELAVSMTEQCAGKMNVSNVVPKLPAAMH